MSVPQEAALAAGVAAIALTMTDVFESVIVPRAPTTTYRLSLLVWRGLWFIWPKIARGLHPRNARMREEVLGAFAPLALLVTLLAWIVVLVVAFGAVFWALRSELSIHSPSYWDAAYFAGTTILTLGFGDIVGRGGAARFVSLCAGATGLGLVSISTAFLFALFGTFQRREAFVVKFSARAGSPPSAIGLYEIAAKTKTLASLDIVMREAQDWIAALMESHLAYPGLSFFRSSHDEQSWVGTLGAVLDAALVATTVLDEGSAGEARICFALGSHAVRDLAAFLGIERETLPPGIEREDFERACDRLEGCGYALRGRDAAWKALVSERAEYACALDAMARFFDIPRAAWIGTRPADAPVH